MDDLRGYYDEIADSFERVYEARDERHAYELRSIARRSAAARAGRSVLEIACGSGYWTRNLAETALSVVATDTSDEMLAEARQKDLPASKVTFQKADAYRLDSVTGEFNGLMAMFWFSHVPRDRLGKFLAGITARIRPGSAVFMADNVFAEGLGGVLVEPTSERDTYKRRPLPDGSTRDILKNYYDISQLRRIFKRHGQVLALESDRYFWSIQYSTPLPSEPPLDLPPVRCASLSQASDLIVAPA